MKTKSHNVINTNTETWAKCCKYEGQRNTFFLEEPGTSTDGEL